MNKEALIGNLHNVLDQINAQLDALNEEAVIRRIRPVDLQDHQGMPVMLPVLCAKAQVLSSIATLSFHETPEVIIFDADNDEGMAVEYEELERALDRIRGGKEEDPSDD